MEFFKSNEAKLKKIAKTMGVTAENKLKQDLDDYLADLLLSFKVSPGLIGYKYLTAAIVAAVFDRSYMHSIKTRLYGDVAKKYDVTNSNVERNIRTVLRTISYGGCVGRVNRWLGMEAFEDGVPMSNGEFICMVGDKMRRTLEMYKGEEFGEL